MPTTNSKTHKEKDRLSRDDIIATAAHLIAEQGLEHLTMRNIATSVGCSVGTLPHYFEGKDDIVIAALHWSSERIFSRLDNIKKRDLDLDKLYPLMSTSMPTKHTNQTLNGAYAFASGIMPPPMRKCVYRSMRSPCMPKKHSHHYCYICKAKNTFVRELISISAQQPFTIYALAQVLVCCIAIWINVKKSLRHSLALLTASKLNIAQ